LELLIHFSIEVSLRLEVISAQTMSSLRLTTFAAPDHPRLLCLLLL
jgi:hypothetical protein